jgi:hypothetical protein
MNTEILTICDAAVDYGGRLSILGAFDVIHAHRFPAVHPHCSVALRIRFDRIESGAHPFILNIVDEDGNNIIPPIQGNMEVKMPPASSPRRSMWSSTCRASSSSGRASTA